MDDTEKTGLVVEEKEIRKWIECDDENWRKNFKYWKYQLRLGEEVYVSSNDVPINLQRNRFAVIKPGDFALLLTQEEIRLSNNVMAFISIRFDYKEKGLINVSGFHVDPCYHGKLIFSVFNAGPEEIILRKGDPIFMIFFERLPFKKGYEVPPRPPGYEKIPTQMISAIRGRSVTLALNATRIDKLEFNLKILGGLIIANLTLLFTLAIKVLRQ